MDNKLMRSLLAEFIGTFTLVFIGGFAVIVIPLLNAGNTVIVPALAHGLILIGIISAYGHISGAHFNPAVTLGLLISGKIDLPKSGMYVVVQFVGGIVAALLITLIVPEDIRASLFGSVEGFNFGQTKGALTDDNVWSAAIFEALLTFILFSTIYHAAVQGKAGAIAPIAIGFTLVGAILAGGNMTGASLNPARTLGPALMAGEFDYVIPYFVGTFAGGALGGVVHSFLLSDDK